MDRGKNRKFEYKKGKEKRKIMNISNYRAVGKIHFFQAS